MWLEPKGLWSMMAITLTVYCNKHARYINDRLWDKGTASNTVAPTSVWGNSNNELLVLKSRRALIKSTPDMY